MTNSVTAFNAAVPAYLQTAEFTGNSDLTAHASLSFPVISIKGKVFAIVRDGERKVIPNPKDPESPAHAIDVLLVKVAPGVSKAYYDVEYKDGEDVKPRCFSNDGKHPDASVANPCCKSCAACQFNRFGSARQGKGKACADSIRIAVAPTNAIDDPLLLRVPATSMKAVGEYGRALDKRRLPYQAVLTRVAFDKETPTPKLLFTAIGFVDQATYLQAIEASKSDTVKAIIGEPTAEEAAAGLDALGDKPDYLTPEPAKTVTREEVRQTVAKAELAEAKAEAKATTAGSLIDEAIAAPAPAPAPAEKPATQVVEGNDALASAFGALDFSD